MRASRVSTAKKSQKINSTVKEGRRAAHDCSCRISWKDVEMSVLTGPVVPMKERKHGEKENGKEYEEGKNKDNRRTERAIEICSKDR